MVKNYGIHDEWKDLNKVNDIDIKSVDGVIDSIKVNGEEAGGGGGGDFNNAAVKIVSNASRAFNGNFGLYNQETGVLWGAVSNNGIYYIFNDDYTVVSVPANGEKDIDVMIVKGEYIFVYFDHQLMTGITVEGSADKYYDQVEGADCVRIWGDCVVTLPAV